MSHYLTLKKIGQAVAYYPNLTKKLGNVNASILLSQFIYWHDKTEHPLGVYKTQDEIKAETGLSRKEQETGRKVLRELGLITETYKRTEHKLYFLFHPEAFDEWFENEAMPESDIRECKKVALPMPESRVAYMEAVHRRYPHEVIYETAQRIGTWELSTKSEKETWAMWKEIYPKVCQEHASGIDFTLPVEKRLEQVQPKPATAEQADEYLDRIKKMLGGAK